MTDDFIAEETKEKSIAQAISGDKTIPELAKELKLPEWQIHAWVASWKKKQPKKRVYEIDGLKFSNMEGFYDLISQIFDIPPHNWGRGEDAFNDILRGGFGTIPEDRGFIIRWKNWRTSRNRLGERKFNDLIDIIECHGANADPKHEQRRGREKIELILD